MKKQDILNTEKLANKIKSFRDLYEGEELWGEVESFVSPEKLIVFLIENPHFQQIADDIKKLTNEVKL